MIRRLLPRSLLGQMLLAVAAALFVAQGISGVLLYRAQEARRELMMVNGAALRLVFAVRAENGEPTRGQRRALREALGEDSGERGLRSFRLERSADLPLLPGERRMDSEEATLREILADQGIDPARIAITQRRMGNDPVAHQWLQRRRSESTRREESRRPLMIAAMQLESGDEWMVTRVPYPAQEPFVLGGIFAQTLILYLVLVGGLALLLRRITRPLAALTKRVETFGETRQADGQLQPSGTKDTRRLIEAHNAMEARIVALLDEKNVMLGAIGHDLKTPLTALRVRIESVENPDQRQRMADTIEDITRTLDDILSLARVGRPSDRPEKVELGALTASVVEEFEDMGEPVTLGDTVRINALVRITWLKRALRNLVGNALRYGEDAEVSMTREGDFAVIRVADTGPGIPDDEIEAMLEPFRRGDPSRNRTTGGAGLGLTLARAIAEQHGGSLVLANRIGNDGKVAGLDAILRLPVA